jgi:two-component system response regulator FixJ
MVALVDGDGERRSAVKALLKTHGVSLIGFDSIEDFLSSLEARPISVLLLDVNSANGGMDTLRGLAEKRLPAPIVLLTGNLTVALAVEALRAGAIDIVERPYRDERLVEATKRAAALGERLRKHLNERRTAQERIALLTPREVQVLDEMVEGKPNRQIAEELGISPKTLDIHRANVMHKMQARTTADLVRFRVLDRTEPIGLVYIGA